MDAGWLWLIGTTIDDLSEGLISSAGFFSTIGLGGSTSSSRIL
jgi:hypothetical protein